MHLSLLLDMAVDGFGDRVAYGPREGGTTYSALRQRARAGAAEVARAGAGHVVYVATNGPAFPVAMLSAALAGVPFVPLNYRLAAEQLDELVARHQPALVVRDPEWVPAGDGEVEAGVDADPEAVALLLYTSGTTAAPKAAVLRHRHLASYVLGTVEFAAAGEADATLVSVPPYHIAGVSNVLSNLYAGRRVVALDAFTPEAWLDTARAEAVTHALVVPTMLARVVDHLDRAGRADAGLPSLRSLAYGGARMPATVIERALRLFPGVDFVNAYGLTETSSTIAVLGPEEHRAGVGLGSVGRVVPGVEVEVRDDDGRPLPAGAAGGLWVRGEQVSGEYAGGVPAAVDAEGWFDTRDRGWLDADGFLFVEGRSDDTIIRGGENIAPAEVEDALLRHPAVAEAAVVGLPDEEWGQRLGAAVVPRPGAEVEPEALRAWVRERLRGSKTPDVIVVRTELPHTDTGKLLRRQVLADLLADPPPPPPPPPTCRS
jgi:acyl-CoA synthetase (AMP-forming)/AMP-acid ligase II